MAGMERSSSEELKNTFSNQGDYEIVCVNPFDDELHNTQSISPSKCIKPVKEKPFECTICNQRFAQKQTLKQHVLTHTGDRPYQCTICLKSFTQVGSMERHMKLHYNEEKPFACHICPLTFRQLNNLKRHVSLHEGNAPMYQCDICCRRFARKDGLLRHAVTHESKRKEFYCQFCGRTFTNKNSLKLHVRMHHDGLVSKTLTCHKCNVEISDENLIPGRNDECICTRCKNTNYETHDINTLSQLEKHACRYCGDKFATERNLHDHVDCFHGDNVYIYRCKLCPETMAKESSLSDHYLLHRHDVADLNDYVRVYQCNDCDQLFTKRSRTVRHVRKHNKVTPIEMVDGLIPAEDMEKTKRECNSRSSEIQRESKSARVFPEDVKCFLSLICSDPEKTSVEINKKTDQSLFMAADSNDGVQSEISSMALLESPSEMENKSGYINIVYDKDEPIAILYNDRVIEQKKSSEDEIKVEYNNERKGDELSWDRITEEVCPDFKYDPNQRRFDVLEQEIYSENLVSGDTYVNKDNIKIGHADQTRIGRTLREKKFEDLHGVHYVEGRKLDGSKEDIPDEYDMAETSSFLLDERTTSAPNSPRMIDDYHYSDAFDSKPNQVKKLTKLPLGKGQRLSLETLKTLVRKPLEPEGSHNKIISHPAVDAGVSEETLIAPSGQDVEKFATKEIEYVQVQLDDDELLFNKVEANCLQNDGKDFFCYLCKKTYSTKASLKRHFQVTHMNQKKVECALCSQTFQTKDALRKHVRALHAPHCFSCSVCKRTFNRKDALASHQRLHSGDRPFACATCGECFAQKQNLYAHSMKHRKEKPYTCALCGKDFSAKSSLTRHMLIHTGERKFTCNVCYRAFQQKCHLDNHLVVHGLVEHRTHFPCVRCEKIFFRKDTLLRHQQTHDPEECRQWFYCNRCNKRLKNKSSLRLHLERNVCKRKTRSEDDLDGEETMKPASKCKINRKR